MNIGANILEFIIGVFDTLGLNVNPLATQIFASIIIFLIFIIIGWIVYHIFERYLSSSIEEIIISGRETSIRTRVNFIPRNEASKTPIGILSIADAPI